MVKALYTKQVAEKVHLLPAPYPGIAFELVDRNTYIAIKLSEKNLMKFNSQQLVSVMEYITNIVNILEINGNGNYKLIGHQKHDIINNITNMIY